VRKIHTQYPQKVNVLCDMMGGYLIESFFLEKNLNARRYERLLVDQIISAIRNIFTNNFEEIFSAGFFQHNRTPPHFSAHRI